jgi:hypothetical protein
MTERWPLEFDRADPRIEGEACAPAASEPSNGVARHERIDAVRRG